MPGRVSSALHLPATSGRGLAETRAGLGGTYAALGAWALLSRQPVAHTAVGVTWLGAAAARLVALRTDDPETDATYWAYLAAELVLGVAAVLSGTREASEDVDMNTPTVPGVIDAYFAAHDERRTDDALTAFTSGATVLDDGHEYVGSDAIRHWLGTASTAFRYTRTLVTAEPAGQDAWLVVNHLEGDFPGGQVELSYRFRLDGDRISELHIAP